MMNMQPQVSQSICCNPYPHCVPPVSPVCYPSQMMIHPPPPQPAMMPPMNMASPLGIVDSLVHQQQSLATNAEASLMQTMACMNKMINSARNSNMCRCNPDMNAFFRYMQQDMQNLPLLVRMNSSEYGRLGYMMRERDIQALNTMGSNESPAAYQPNQATSLDDIQSIVHNSMSGQRKSTNSRQSATPTSRRSRASRASRSSHKSASPVGHQSRSSSRKSASSARKSSTGARKSATGARKSAAGSRKSQSGRKSMGGDRKSMSGRKSVARG